jgi:hypothetical protein
LGLCCPPGHPAFSSIHSILHFDGTTHRVDHTAEFNERPVTGTLNHTPAMHGDCRIDEVTSQCPQPGEGAILDRAGWPAVADNICRQDRCEFPRLGHDLPTKFVALRRVSAPESQKNGTPQYLVL